MVSKPIVEIEGVSKAYAGVRALVDVSFDIRAGEVHGLVGENGAGKSTIIKILAGAVKRDAGSIRVGGQEVAIASEREAGALGLRFIHQDLGAIGRLSVAENVFLGKRLPHRGPFVSRRLAGQQVREILAGFVDVDPRRRMSSLSVAQQWMVAVARACRGDAQLVVMDEPTVALSEVEVQLVFGAVRRLRERGIAVLFVSHRLAEVLELSDRVTVLKDGRLVGTHDVDSLDRASLVSFIVGEESGGHVLEQPLPIPDEADVVLSARSLYGGPLRDVSFDVRRGEILGIAGLVGSGRTSLLQQCFGVHRPVSGQIFVEGEPVTIRSPSDAVKRGMAMIPEERRTQGLMVLRSVRDNIVEVHLPRFRWHPLLPAPSRRQETRETARQITAMSIRTSGTEQLVKQLSGGNQQKVLVGRWLAGTGLRVLMLDEPTKGVDVGGKAEIYGIVRDLAATGVAVLVVSSDLEEVAAVCHRVVVLVEGQLAGALSAPMTEQEILRLCYPARAA